MLAMKFEGGGIVCLAVCSVSFCSGSLSWSSQLFAPGLPSIYFILASLKSTEVRSPCSLQVVGEIFHPYNLSGRHDLADLARLSICSRYFVVCWTIWRGREVPAAGLVVVLVALLPRRV